MKKKRTPSASASVSVTPASLARTARSRKNARCIICGNDVAQFSTEELCWICRRLKISAWRDADNQTSAQE